MNKHIRTAVENITSPDRQVQTRAYFTLLELTETPVDWAYAVWDELLEHLTHADNHVRSIAAQVLCNLAQSDPDQRMQKDFRTLLEVTRDQRFVTARHTLQTIWKVGLAGKAQQNLVLEGLQNRFHECISEKNCTLIRYDIQQGLRNLYDRLSDESIRAKALLLIETEADPKYRKKYAGVWK